MTDPNPLLQQTEMAAPQPPAEAAAHHQHRSLDDTIEYYIGNFGWKQFLQSTILSFAWFFDAQQAFVSVFTDAVPKWSCKNPTCNSTNTNICQLPKDSWSWDLPAHTSIISEWSLECAGPIITGLPASSFFFGCLAGGFVLSTLADSSLGRKNLLVLSCFLMSISGLLTVISTNVWIYSGLRFFSGLGRATIGTCSLVLATELVGKKWRGNVGIIGFILFAFGFLSLPIIAFLLRGRSWKLIYLCICIPCLFYSILLYFSVQESPRWLFIKGKKEEFAKTLRSMASLDNLSTLTESFFSKSVKWAEISQEHDLYSALKILLQKRWASKRLAAVMVVAFGVGTIYYGMPLGLGNLSFNLYLSVGLNALSELPASLVTFFLIGKLNRKGSVLGLSLLSGICSVGCALVKWKGVQIAAELVSFFSACTAVDVFLIYSLELFPTCVRNSAVAMARQAVVFSGVVSPVLVAAGRRNGWLSYGVFGATISICGLFVLWLPETKGRRLCDTIEEEEFKIGEVC
ncbi:Synaptic vesicle transporter SVOP and related transporters (major facilitator superfamily) [Handroanthus impetiginosus]|uniref:Synaptic vesicle transporter SVOP and related transporters (Major facilitator superfamily) n=1 Tax=Handroanthus impetiginosus TaxID=429701 RepID=A0A2G9GMG0_9LAMI|nr:Synaptic vesicle transporter SVOP and related transporters (major facilitator superfamily) [Handroanthus impetiginosus]